MGCWALEINWPVVTQGFGAVAQGVGALVLGGVGVWGLSSWKTQAKLGKQQAVAEEGLTLAYRVLDAIEVIQKPSMWQEELDLVERRPDESDEHYFARAFYAVVELRSAQYTELVAQLAAMHFRVQALLGEQPSQALKDVMDGYDKVLKNARSAGRAVERIRKLELALETEQDSRKKMMLGLASARLKTLEEFFWPDSDYQDVLETDEYHPVRDPDVAGIRRNVEGQLQQFARLGD